MRIWQPTNTAASVRIETKYLQSNLILFVVTLKSWQKMNETGGVFSDVKICTFSFSYQIDNHWVFNVVQTKYVILRYPFRIVFVIVFVLFAG